MLQIVACHGDRQVAATRKGPRGVMGSFGYRLHTARPTPVHPLSWLHRGQLAVEPSHDTAALIVLMHAVWPAKKII